MEKNNILITGVSKGFGRNLSIFLKSKGFNVYGLARKKETELDEELRSSLIKYAQVDLSDLSEVQNFLQDWNRVGIDYLIINASERQFKKFSEFSGKEISSIIESSFTNQAIILNDVIKKMFDANYGRVIIISSKSGLKGYSKGSLYCSVKSAWNTLYESLAREIRDTEKNVSIVNIICDSFSNTEGKQLPYYKKTLEKICETVLELQHKKMNGIIYNMKLKTRMLIRLNYLVKFFYK